jgi:hypothetical protein
MLAPSAWAATGPAAGPAHPVPPPPRLRTDRHAPIDRELGQALAAVEQLRPAARPVRVGWLFVAGRTRQRDGTVRRVFHPLVNVPVTPSPVPAAFGSALLIATGDVEVTDLVADPEVRAELDEAVEWGGGALEGTTGPAIDPALLDRLEGLHGFATRAAAAAGLRATELVPATDDPEAYLGRDGLVIVAGVAVYALHGTDLGSRAGSLRAWAAGPLPSWTAFHSLYADAPPPPHHAPSGPPVTDLPSPFVLSPAQQRAVVRARRENVTLVAGAPGTGKSQTVAAIACDALAHGRSVLVAARSDATIDALIELFERAPGPRPVVFGSDERREALATVLAGGQLLPAPETTLAAAAHDCRSAVEAYRSRAAAIRQLLTTEAGAERHEWGAGRSRVLAPGLFGPDAALDRAQVLLDALGRPAPGPIARWRLTKVRRELSLLAGCPPTTPYAELRTAYEDARTERARFDLDARGGLTLEAEWHALVDLHEQVRDRVGRWLEADSRSDRRLNQATLPAVAAVATALRSGRGGRRRLLAQIPAEALTRAMPLWVGSLPDIDDLLPAVAGYFDVVILDEASCIDQTLAAPALLRARRAVVVGDPRQLRHVSFVSDDHVDETRRRHGVDAAPLLAARLDVRRNSAFDVAAGVSPVLTLDEHFRSDPHLFEFVAERIYDGAVRVATQAPSTVRRDCVHVRRITGERDRHGVVRAEVDWVMDHLTRLRTAGVRSVGVIAPFRAQADALEAAALDRFTVNDLRALDLRVGTVHAFQGNERDHVVASIGIDDTDDAAAWRFLADPGLFAVFATRARTDLTLILSAEPPPGLLADYLADADRPPGDPAGAPAASPWIAAIAEDLRSGGLPVVTGYPTGRHELDLCIAARGDLALECRVHPDGPDAHIARRLALRQAGWAVHDAFPSRWAHRRAELVVELLHRFGPQRPQAPPTA